MEQSLQQYVTAYHKLLPQLAGHKATWLRQLRNEAIAHFAAAGWPTSRDEAWKYTRLNALADRYFQPGAAMATVTHEQLKPWLNASPTLVFVDGIYRPDLSLLPDDFPIQLTSLAQQLLEHPEMLQAYLGKALGNHYHSLTALNTALLQDGYCLNVPAAMQLSQPLELLFVAATPDKSNQLRNLLVVGEHSQVQIIERYIGLCDESYFTNAVTEIYLANHAVLTHIKVQQEQSKSIHIAATGVQQAQNSQFLSHQFSYGARLARHDIQVELMAAKASCKLNGLYLVADKQHVDFHTHIDHRQPDTKSYELYKGILAGQSRGVFNGKIFVHPQAQKTDAQLNNKNLLLSRQAEIDTKPELEIYADDVQCRHGATVGQLDENALFYLHSRGITEAKQLLTYAFASELLAELPYPSLQQQLQAIILERLGAASIRQELLS